MDEEVVTLWRPTGTRELELIAQSGWREWPPRLLEQLPMEFMAETQKLIGVSLEGSVG